MNSRRCQFHWLLLYCESSWVSSDEVKYTEL